MFKSTRRKISLSFVVLTLILLLAVWIAFPLGMMISDRNSFRDDCSALLSTSFVSQLSSAAAHREYVQTTANPEIGSYIVEEVPTDNLPSLVSLLEQNAGDFLKNSDRSCYILDSSANVLYSSPGAAPPATTQSIEDARQNTASSQISMRGSYMDYALPVAADGEVKYIIYLFDSRQMHYQDIASFMKVSAYAALPAVAAVIICGIFTARIVTRPLTELNARTKELFNGDTNAMDLFPPGDEFGEIASTLTKMAEGLNESMAEIRNQKTTVETILQNMHDGVLAFDLKGELTHINPEAKKLLNRNFVDDISFDSFFKEINANITLGDLLYVSQDSSLERQVCIQNDKYLQMNFAAFRVDDKISGILVVIHDITKQQKLDQSRRNFVADVSHELRTPLTTIKSYAETLVSAPSADKALQSRFLEVIASEADRMARILSDLLTLSALDEKTAAFKAPEPIDVRLMLETVTERMRINSRKKKQTLLYTPINEVPVIQGDRDGLERVIVNVLSNAIKYTPAEGRIDVFSSRLFSDICIKVVDNGIGIPEENLPHIFDRFYRVDKARSRDTGGTGLGLAIAKQTIESSFGGRIKINSQLHKGTEVVITIPLPKTK